MSAFSPKVLFKVNENALMSSEVPTGPFCISRNGSSDLKSFAKNAEWSMIQKARYIAFLELNCKKMEGRPHGKLWNIYQEMGEFIKTRNFRQCKSYHQKNVQEHTSISEIITIFKRSSLQLEPLINREREQLLELSNKVNAASQKSIGLKVDEKTAPSYLTEHSISADRSKEQGWRQCHELFLEWTNKLKDLILPELTTSLYA